MVEFHGACAYFCKQRKQRFALAIMYVGTMNIHYCAFHGSHENSNCLCSVSSSTYERVDKKAEE